MSKFFARAREPMSSATHFWGAVLSGAGLIVLFWKSFEQSCGLRLTLSALLFGFSQVALYTASSVYHYSTSSAKHILKLRKWDHAMIYVLIAGTYTPILLELLPGREGTFFTILIWCLAALGIGVKLFWFQAPRWLQTAFYLAMGWVILLKPSIFRLMDGGMFALLALGGACYTAGGIIYGVKKPNFSENFGFHELFHVFVMLGSLFHFLLIYQFFA